MVENPEITEKIISDATQGWELDRNIAKKVWKYYIETEDTVRGAARRFGISKSSIHKDVSQRLLKINYPLAMEVRKVLDKNKAERHIRGGMATKLKYEHMSEEKYKRKI